MLKIGPDTIKKYEHLLTKQSIATNEQKRRFSSVDKFLRWAHEKGYLGHEDFNRVLRSWPVRV
jgi:site-specific recombinase XerD